MVALGNIYNKGVIKQTSMANAKKMHFISHKKCAYKIVKA